MQKQHGLIVLLYILSKRVDSNIKKLKLQMLQDKKKTCKGNKKFSRHRRYGNLLNQLTQS